jgi:hypothetical protein
VFASANELTKQRVEDLENDMKSIASLNWQSIFQSFEILQNLPYEKAAKCPNSECDGIVFDGKYISTRTSLVHLEPLPVQKNSTTTTTKPFKPLQFQDLSLIKSNDTRLLMFRFNIQCLSSALSNYTIILNG